MDVLTDDVAELDGPRLAALWTRAVLAADPVMIARCEDECHARGIRPLALIAATKQPEPGDRKKHYAEVIAQSQKNIREGKKYNTGQKTTGKGYNPYRKKKGEKGGGQFASKDDSGVEKTDPDQARDGAELQEDDERIPEKSPSGAEIDDFRDGMMIYEDGTRFDGKGWRDSKGRALDAEGNVIKKKKPGTKTKEEREAETAKKKAEREADKAKKDADRAESQAWDSAEARRQADDAASKGNFTSLLSIVERTEREARKRRDLAKDDAARQKADADVSAAQKELADVKDGAEKAKAAKEVTDKAEREAKSEASKKEREAKRTAEQVAEYAEIAKNYPTWEKELRAQYTDVGLSEAELADLVIRDRARRVRLLPRKRAVAAAGFDPNLHPKGKDGKFIETFGLIDVFGLSGFQHGQRGAKQVQGQVVEIVPNPKSPGDPIIRVKMTDPRWNPAQFGETVDVKRSQVAQRVKPKAKLPSKAPTPDIAKPKVAVTDTGQIPMRAPTPGLTPHPDGPHLAPIEPPGDWATMAPEARIKFLEDRMSADYLAWRGEPTVFDLTGFDSGIAFNLANTYRDLTNWDPDTARRIDYPILGNTSEMHDGDLAKRAVAVAHPGTAHPGGIGKKLGPAQIVFRTKYAASPEFWAKQKELSDQLVDQGDEPWSTSSMTGDPSVTLIHEFGHHRQFRYLDISLRDVGKAWSPAVRDDGFGLIPDSSNWSETQALRYQIPVLSQTQYGHTKSSEGFAEGIAERALGIANPELTATFDEWDEYMGVSLHLPADRHAQSRSFNDLTAAEKDQFWQANGPYLELPGMRSHYPDSAKAYDAWMTGKQIPPAESTPEADKSMADLMDLLAIEGPPGLPTAAEALGDLLHQPGYQPGAAEMVAPTPQGPQVAVLDQAWGRSVIEGPMRARYKRDTAYLEAQMDANPTKPYYLIEYPDGTSSTGGLAQWVHARRQGQAPVGDMQKDWAALDTLDTDKPNNRRLNHWAKRIAHGVGQDRWEPDDTHPELNAAVDEGIAVNANLPMMSAAVQKFGPIPVAVVKTDHNAAARQLGVGTTVIMNDPLEWGDPGEAVEIDAPITGPTDDSWTVSKGIAGTLRHEYGHYVETMVDNGAGPELAEPYARWKDAYKAWNGGGSYNVNVGEDVGKMMEAGPGGLSKYARANTQEGFAETFALVTHPDFDRTKIADGTPLADMVDAMTDLIGAP